jgi:heme exporter protein D
MSALFELGPNAGFIWMAYGVSVLVLAGLIGWIRFDARHQMHLLADLEAKGIRRRSSPARGSKGKKSSKRT